MRVRINYDEHGGNETSLRRYLDSATVDDIGTLVRLHEAAVGSIDSLGV